MLKGSPFPNVLDEIDLFLTENPGEFVVVETIHDPNKHGMRPEQILSALRLISSTFSNSAITREDANTWFNLKKTTLGDMRSKSKNVLALINDGFCTAHGGTSYDEETIAREFACHRNGTLMKTKWHNTQCAGTLLGCNDRFLEDKASGRKFMNNRKWDMRA